MQFNYILFNADESRIPELITESRTMIGLSDGGAHVDSICDAGYATYLLGTWVRERQAMSLEHAVKRITSEPADFFGIKQTRTHRARAWRRTSRSSTSPPSAPM
jgi:N-acyl-D-amino-acid deacylase